MARLVRIFDMGSPFDTTGFEAAPEGSDVFGNPDPNPVIPHYGGSLHPSNLSLADDNPQQQDDGNLTPIISQIFPPGGWFPAGSSPFPGDNAPAGTTSTAPSGGGGSSSQGFFAQHGGAILALGAAAAVVGLILYAHEG